MDSKSTWAVGGIVILGCILWLVNRCKGYLPIEVLAVDSNNNGVIDNSDGVAFLGAFGSHEGEFNYKRLFDMDFDGHISDIDKEHFDKVKGKDLSSIRESIKTNTAQYLEWPDGWGAWMVALKNDSLCPVQDFTGCEVTMNEGWIHDIYHPYIWDDYTYVCHHFALDTAIAAYKALGYGCLLYAESRPHSYIIYWTGGDWHDLHNWQIIEPQDGINMGCAATQDSGFYQTLFILFLDKFAGYGETSEHVLFVDYNNKRVDYWPGFIAWAAFSETLEEPVPNVFNRSLGIPK